MHPGHKHEHRGDEVDYETDYPDHAEPEEYQLDVQGELFPVRLSRKFESSPS